MPVPEDVRVPVRDAVRDSDGVAVCVRLLLCVALGVRVSLRVPEDVFVPEKLGVAVGLGVHDWDGVRACDLVAVPLGDKVGDGVSVGLDDCD